MIRSLSGFQKLQLDINIFMLGAMSPERAMPGRPLFDDLQNLEE
jgi:hypothetical protein